MINPTINQALAWAAAPEAELLLGFVLNQEVSFLTTHGSTRLTLRPWLKFRRLVTKQRQGWPIAYLTHVKWFYGRPWYVNKHVLIPRPDSETLIEQCLKIIQEHSDPAAPLTVIDVGTGSGCLAVTIAAACPTAKVIATDISRAALRVARRNARAQGVAQKIKFFHGDLLAAVPAALITAPVVIMANLPYLPQNHDYRTTPYEPRRALGGRSADGLALVKKLIHQTRQVPSPGWIMLEIDPRQAAAVKKFIPNALPGRKLNIINDLSNQPRVVTYQQ